MSKHRDEALNAANQLLNMIRAGNKPGSENTVARFVEKLFDVLADIERRLGRLIDVEDAFAVSWPWRTKAVTSRVRSR
jgi:hypothetical protein